MSEKNFSFEEITKLMEKLASTGLGELSLRDGDFELLLKAKAPAAISVVPATEVPAAAEAAAAPEKTESAMQGKVVKSPIVGTFYAAPAPDKEPYVKVGSKVRKGDVLFVIESMKLMNEIASDYDGEVAEILVSDAQGVEFGQPIMLIR